MAMVVVVVEGVVVEVGEVGRRRARDDMDETCLGLPNEAIKSRASESLSSV
jgi:hypothetical protein